MKLIPKIGDKEILCPEYNIFFYLKHNLFVINMESLDGRLKADLERSRFNVLNPMKVFINKEGLFVETLEKFYHFSYAAYKLKELLANTDEIILSLSYNENEDGSLDLVNLGTVSDEGSENIYNTDAKINRKDEVLVFRENKEENVDVINIINYLNNPQNAKLPENINKNIEVLFMGDYPYISEKILEETENEKKLFVYYSKDRSAIIIKKIDEQMIKEINSDPKDILNFLFLREVGKAVYSEMLAEANVENILH